MLRVKNCKFYACGGGVNLRKGKEKGKYKYNNFHFLSPTSLPRCIVIMCIRDCLMEYSGCQWRREDDDIMKKVVSLVGSTCSLCL